MYIFKYIDERRYRLILMALKGGENGMQGKTYKNGLS